MQRSNRHRRIGLIVLAAPIAIFSAAGCQSKDDKPSAPGYYTGTLKPKSMGPSTGGASKVPATGGQATGQP